MAWRLEPGGYLAKILTATVYDVAVSVRAMQCCLLRLSGAEQQPHSGLRCSGRGSPDCLPVQSTQSLWLSHACHLTLHGPRLTPPAALAGIPTPAFLSRLHQLSFTRAASL